MSRPTGVQIQTTPSPKKINYEEKIVYSTRHQWPSPRKEIYLTHPRGGKTDDWHNKKKSRSCSDSVVGTVPVLSCTLVVSISTCWLSKVSGLLPLTSTYPRKVQYYSVRYLKYSSQSNMDAYCATKYMRSVLRIRDVYPGSRISDPRSKNSNKRERWKKNCYHTFFCSHKFHIIENYFIFKMLKKKIWANFQRIIEHLL